METIVKYSGLVALVILAIMGGRTLFASGLIAGSATACTDGYTCYTNLEVQGNGITDGTSLFSGAVSLTSTFKLGSSGTAQSNQVVTTCSMIANGSVTASTTGYLGYCTGVTGVTSADYVTASFASSTPTLGGAQNWVITNAVASTTAGAIDIFGINFSGTSRAMSAATQLGSTTVIKASH